MDNLSLIKKTTMINFIVEKEINSILKDFFSDEKSEKNLSKFALSLSDEQKKDFQKCLKDFETKLKKINKIHTKMDTELCQHFGVTMKNSDKEFALEVSQMKLPS